ncbi:MAG: DNA adenine methylase [Thermocrinis sp.]|jgi:DNA adenine methylase|uniref:DNA adenine methylase n=1 Tax=Thermocrinis sp. TaxID=2024383 RepID=UPI003C11FB22
MKTPLCYYGGKGNLIRKLLAYVPYHEYYLEVFGGSAALLFAKESVGAEVYNDIDGDLVNLFRVIRDHFDEFYRKVALTPYSREEYLFCSQSYKECDDPIERARRFFVAIRQSFNGNPGAGWRYSLKIKKRGFLASVSSWLSALEDLPYAYLRLIHVQIENLHWRECMEKYNDWEWAGFFYLDPPYLPDTRREPNVYKFEMSRKDHEELVEWLLTKAKTKVMLSGYDNDLYFELEKAGWKKVCFDVGCHAVGRTRRTGLLGEGATLKHGQRRRECIWINYWLDF